MVVVGHCTDSLAGLYKLAVAMQEFADVCSGHCSTVCACALNRTLGDPQVPASMNPAPKAADLMADMRSTGLNHMAFNVGPAIDAHGLEDLKGFLSALNRQV